MYTKDKTLRVTFRAEPGLANWISDQAQRLGVTPSAFARQSLYAQMSAQLQFSGILKDTVTRGIKDELTSTEKAVTNADDLLNQ